MMQERQRITINLDKLFPGEPLTIGDSSVIIRPLYLEQIAILSKKITSIGEVLQKEGITWENYEDRASLFKVGSILLNHFPEVLEEVSNIAIEDLKQLPLTSIIEILQKVVEVNLQSKDDLLKNFKSLTEKLVPTTTMTNQNDQKMN